METVFQRESVENQGVAANGRPWFSVKESVFSADMMMVAGIRSGWLQKDKCKIVKLVFTFVPYCATFLSIGTRNMLENGIFDDQLATLDIPEIEMLYNFDSDEYTEDMLFFSDCNGTEIIVHTREIALIELPLIAAEDAICAYLQEE